MSYAVAPKVAPSAGGEVTQHREEEDKLFLHSTGSAGPDTPQCMVGPSSCQGTLPTQIQVATNQNVQVPFCWTALQLLAPHTVRAVPFQVQNPALALLHAPNTAMFCLSGDILKVS